MFLGKEKLFEWMELIEPKTSIIIQNIQKPKTTPNHASLKQNEEYVYKNVMNKRKKTFRILIFKITKLTVDDSVGAADKRHIFSKIEKTNWNYALFSVTKVIDKTIAQNRICYTPERYQETLWRKTVLTMQES